MCQTLQIFTSKDIHNDEVGYSWRKKKKKKKEEEKHKQKKKSEKSKFKNLFKITQIQWVLRVEFKSRALTLSYNAIMALRRMKKKKNCNITYIKRMQKNGQVVQKS